MAKRVFHLVGCDYEGCSARSVDAHDPRAARKLAREQGWWIRGQRGPRRDYCPDHIPERLRGDEGWR